MQLERLEDMRVISILIVVMFFMSGIHKATHFKKTVDNFISKTNMGGMISNIIIILVILLEIFAPLCIVYYTFTGKYQKHAYYSVIGLVIFTILATIMYHLPDISNYYKSVAFWSNMSLIGGLLLLGKVIKGASL